MTPAERLRAAATRLREVSGAATPGPWEACEGDPNAFGFRPSVIFMAERGHDAAEIENSGDAAYIAMMHPPVALALADWLTKEATLSEGFTPRAALAVADAVLGGEQR